MAVSRRTFGRNLLLTGATLATAPTAMAHGSGTAPERATGIHAGSTNAIPAFPTVDREYTFDCGRLAIRQWRWPDGTLTLDRDELCLTTTATGTCALSAAQVSLAAEAIPLIRAHCPSEVSEEFNSEIVFRQLAAASFA